MGPLLALTLSFALSLAVGAGAAARVNKPWTALAFRGGDAHLGGACGFKKPFPSKSTYVAGASTGMFSRGICGRCFELTCVRSKNCNPGSSVVVTIANECSGGQGKNASGVCKHDAFNLQPEAYDVLAKTRDAIISVAFQPVACQYPGGVQVSVLVATQGFLQLGFQNVAGTGNLRGVEVSSTGGAPWEPMTFNYGQVWQKDNFVIFNKYLSFRLTAYGGQTLILDNVLPPHFRAQRLYNATVNFK